MDTPAPQARTWKVGTLTYTTGSLAVLVIWLLWGDIAWWTRERSALPMMQLMLKTFQASDFITGLLLITVPSLTYALLAPLVSYWSDNYRSRLGRRIPFLLATTPLVTIAMIGLGLCVPTAELLRSILGWDASHTNASVLWVLGFWWMIFEIGALTANAVFAALINDVVPRALIGRFFGVFRAVSLAVGIIFNSKIIGIAEVHFKPIFITIGIIYGAGLVLMCLRVKEGEYPPVPPERMKASVFTIYKTYFRECFTKYYYLLGIIFFALGNLAYVPVNTFSVAAAKSYGMSMDVFGKYYVVMFITSFTLAFPLGWLADKFHPLRVSMGALICSSIAALVSFFLIKSPETFGYGLLAHGVFSGCFYTGSASLCQVIFPKHRCAQLIAASWIFNAIVQILFGPALGGLLDFVGNQYRFAFLVGCVIGTLALVMGWLLLRAKPPEEDLHA